MSHYVPVCFLLTSMHAHTAEAEASVLQIIPWSGQSRQQCNLPSKQGSQGAMAAPGGLLLDISAAELHTDICLRNAA